MKGKDTATHYTLVLGSVVINGMVYCVQVIIHSPVLPEFIACEGLFGSKVEVLDSSSGRWHSPQPVAFCKSSICSVSYTEKTQSTSLWNCRCLERHVQTGDLSTNNGSNFEFDDRIPPDHSPSPATITKYSRKISSKLLSLPCWNTRRRKRRRRKKERRVR